jgi:hypothetical protein
MWARFATGSKRVLRAAPGLNPLGLVDVYSSWSIRLKLYERPFDKVAMVARSLAIVIMGMLLGNVVAPDARAKSTPPLLPKFEVASIRACKSTSAGTRGGGRWPPTIDPTRLLLNCLQLDFLIRVAYLEYANGNSRREDIFAVPIQGEPGWFLSDRFNIEAKTATPAGSKIMPGPMLRALLEERFHRPDGHLRKAGLRQNCR